MSTEGVRRLFCAAAILWSSEALAQSAYLEGHVFNKRTGVPIENAVVVIYENFTNGAVPVLLAELRTDSNGFYQSEVITNFPTGIIAVFCRTPAGAVVRGRSSAPIQEEVIRRRDIYLDAPLLRLDCLDPRPGDIPPFRRP